MVFSILHQPGAALSRLRDDRHGPDAARKSIGRLRGVATGDVVDPCRVESPARGSRRLGQAGVQIRRFRPPSGVPGQQSSLETRRSVQTLTLMRRSIDTYMIYLLTCAHWCRFVIKYGGFGVTQVKLFQITPYVNDLQTLINPVS